LIKEVDDPGSIGEPFCMPSTFLKRDPAKIEGMVLIAEADLNEEIIIV
jgi:hypothetical protein